MMNIVSKNWRHLPWMVFVIACLSQPTHAWGRSLLVIVDMEPDDRIALLLLGAQFREEIVSIGTTGLHAGRRQILAQHLLDAMDLAAIPVIQGTGGEAESYPSIVSTSAARAYRGEGHGLLSDAELSAIDRDTPRSSEALQLAIRELLRERDDIEVVLLAPATDLVHALEAEPALQARVQHIHTMGGWSEKVDASGKSVRRTTYNWNMDPVAAAKLMSMKTMPMTLYSSHLIKASFAGGSINQDDFPEIIGELESQRCRIPAIEAFFIAADSWDHHLMEKIPPLQTIIGDNAGRQFTPADPLVVVGMASGEFVTETRPVDVTIDLDDLDPARGFSVQVSTNPDSRIALVEALDTEIFRQQMLEGLRGIAATAKHLSGAACKAGG